MDKVNKNYMPALCDFCGKYVDNGEYEVIKKNGYRPRYICHACIQQQREQARTEGKD